MNRDTKFVMLMLAVMFFSTVVPPSKGIAAPGDDCTDPLPYGLINDAPQNGSIVSLGEQWYSFTGPDDMTVTVSLCDSGYDTKLEVWYACSDGTYAFYNDDACGAQSEITGIPFVGGSTYFVKVYGYSTASGSFTLNITGVPPPPDPDPVTAFPFTEDFEGGSFPATMVPNVKSQSDLTIDTYAGNNSTYGAMFEGGPSSWGATPSSVTAAFAYTDHVAKMEMVVEPSGQPGLLQLEFDLVQRYSFNANYEWFRVLVDGVPVPDEDGNLYHQATSSTGDTWKHLVYDLSAYQGLGSFDLTLENAAKYNFAYYQDGDLGCVDNVSLYYLVIGDVEGYVLNGDGLSIAGADVWMDGYPATQTDSTGYYFLSQVAGSDQDVNASKDGYNSTTDNFYITPGGTTTHDFVLTKPGLTINPLSFYETLHPNENLTTYLGILNIGDGVGSWQAVINYPSANGLTGWLTLSDYDDTVPGNGGIQNIGVNFNATGAEVGEVYTAEIEMTTDPDVGTFVVPVTMTIFYKNTTSISLAASPDPATYGDSATLTATLTATGQTPTGPVYFLDDSRSVLCGPVSLSGLEATCDTPSLDAGTHIFSAIFSGDNNFIASEGTLELTVKKADQVIVFDDLPDRLATDSPFTVDAIASSGLDVAFSSGTPSVCTVAGDVVSLVDAGECAILASQKGDANYNAAPSVVQAFTVRQEDDKTDFPWLIFLPALVSPNKIMDQQ